MRYKYCLIVSQYYYSYHTFIVEIKEDFYEQTLKLIKDLEDMKREQKKEYYYGDLDYNDFDINNMFTRYNLNDDGDIYFINSNYINRLVDECVKLTKLYRRNGYIKKEIKDKTFKHHDYFHIKNIIEKYFKLI